MVNQILALEDAYRLLVNAMCQSSGAVENKLWRIAKYINAQISEAVEKVSES